MTQYKVSLKVDSQNQDSVVLDTSSPELAIAIARADGFYMNESIVVREVIGSHKSEILAEASPWDENQLQLALLKSIVNSDIVSRPGWTIAKGTMLGVLLGLMIVAIGSVFLGLFVP